MTAGWSHGVYTCVLLFVQMNMVLLGVWKLLPRMHQTWRSSKEALSLKVGLKYLQLTSISPSEASKAMTFLEFSKLFRGTVNLVYVNFTNWNCELICWKKLLVMHKVDCQNICGVVEKQVVQYVFCISSAC